jgi:hypothetical protein
MQVTDEKEAMKYIMLIYQGTALERQAALPEEEEEPGSPRYSTRPVWQARQEAFDTLRAALSASNACGGEAYEPLAPTRPGPIISQIHRN